MIGETLSHYRIRAQLGSGGMGVVYRAEDLKLGRDVALKLLPPELCSDPSAVERLRREARAASALNHPHICTVYEIDAADGHEFIAMEVLEGRTLRERLQEGALDAGEVRRLGAQVAEALETAHAHGILHRDIKPANLFLTDSGRVKVLDFGLAKRVAGEQPGEASLLSALTESGALVGTVAYMSPEQARGEPVDARSDLFSLGAVLYEMLTGYRAFSGDTSALVYDAILNRAPMAPSQLRRRIPPDLEATVMRALAKRPAERFESAAALRKALVEGDGAAAEAGRGATASSGSGAGRLLRGLLSLVTGGRAKETPSRTPTPSPAPARAKPERPMLAVLPFENLGPADDAYFALGMTEEITSRLAAVRELGVISRTSTASLDVRGRTLREVGAELGVDYVLEGTVRWQRVSGGASRVRVTPVLVRVADDTRLWSEAFDRSLEEVFAVQGAVAERVVEALDVTLMGPERAAIEERPTENLDAYQAYLKGLDYLNRLARPEADLRLAVRLFGRAVELDAGFAQAWAALSEAHAMLHHMRYDPAPERLEEAKRAADRTLALRPDLAEGHLALGNYFFLGLKDHAAALAEFAIAERTMPDDPRLRAAIGYTLRLQGRFAEAETSLRRAFRLSPRDPDLAFEMALTYSGLRDYENAERFCERSIALAPDQAPAYGFQFFTVCRRRGDTGGGRAILEAIPAEARSPFTLWSWFFLEAFERRWQAALERVAASPFEVVEALHLFVPKALLEGIALDELGRKDEARLAFERAAARAGAGAEDPRRESSLGLALAYLGRVDEAVAHGRRALELYPMAKDAYVGAVRLEDLAWIEARCGLVGEATERLEHLLAIPSFLSAPLLRLDPRWDPLRGQPRFARLLEGAPGG